MALDNEIEDLRQPLSERERENLIRDVRLRPRFSKLHDIREQPRNESQIRGRVVFSGPAGIVVVVIPFSKYVRERGKDDAAIEPTGPGNCPEGYQCYMWTNPGTAPSIDSSNSIAYRCYSNPGPPVPITARLHTEKQGRCFETSSANGSPSDTVSK